VVLDLQAVVAIDPSGVYAIVLASRAAHVEGRRLVIVRPPNHVDAALKHAGADGALTVVDTSAAARRAPHAPTSAGGPGRKSPLA